MNTKDEIKKRKVAAVDIFIAVLLLMCIIAVGIRIFMGERAFFTGDAKGEYTVSYTVTGTADEYSNYFSDGTALCLESGEPFGTLSGNATFTPAEIYTENSRGESVHGYATDGSVDIKGTVTVSGTMTDSGFLLNSTTYIAPNMTLTVASADITVTLLITDITKAQ